MTPVPEIYYYAFSFYEQNQSFGLWRVDDNSREWAVQTGENRTLEWMQGSTATGRKENQGEKARKEGRTFIEGK